MPVRVNILEKGFGKKHPVKRIRDEFFRPYWFPVDYCADEILRLGYKIRYFRKICAELFDCDILIVSSRSVESIANLQSMQRFDLCSEIRSKSKRLVWFDTRDSAGNCQFDILPLVDVYLKRQIYRDLTWYSKPLYAGRVFADYYHSKFNVIDQNSEALLDHEVTSDKEGLKKLRAAWGCGAEFHWPHMTRLSSAKYYLSAASWSNFGLMPPRPECVGAHNERHTDVAALFDPSRYSRNTVGWQRRLAIQAVEALKPELTRLSGRVARSSFYHTLANSKICVSAFGWGEVCFREYEATYCGAAVLMADMSGIDTYPNLYQPGEYYTPFKWDFSDFEEKVDWLLSNDARRIEMVRNAQNFLMSQWTASGRENFALRFKDLIDARDPLENRS